MKFAPEQIYIFDLFSKDGSKDGRKFVIPAYQRPYCWEEDECETLWNDILENVFGKEGKIEGKEYFLGVMVAWENKEGELEIIDGQQRITTFTLLFKAIYDSFNQEIGDSATKDDFRDDFSKCIWKFIRNSGPVFQVPRLTSKVITDTSSRIFESILSDSRAQFFKEIQKYNEYKRDKSKKPAILARHPTNYAKNYAYFVEGLIKLKSRLQNPEDFYNIFLERHLFVLLVKCDSEESGRIIFNTLNSRGIQLSTADLLKNYIYGKIRDEKKKTKFIDDWKYIESKIEDNSKKIDSFDFLFLQYMQIIRAIKNDSTGSSRDLLDFFTDERDSKGKCYGAREGWLEKEETMPFISNLADFWISPDDYLTEKSIRYMSILNTLKTDSWKIFVSLLVWRTKELFGKEFELGERNIDKEKFSVEFEKYLPELIKEITSLLLKNAATKDAIRKIAAKMSMELCNSPKEGGNTFSSEYTMPSENIFEENTFNFRSWQTKFILFVNSSLVAERLIDEGKAERVTLEYDPKLQIEHILPKKWQNACFDDWDEESHQTYLEKIGNKVLLDKPTNLKCSNNFFAKKQKAYKEPTNLEEVQSLGKREKKTWDKNDIDTRSLEIYRNLSDFLEGKNGF